MKRLSILFAIILAMALMVPVITSCAEADDLQNPGVNDPFTPQDNDDRDNNPVDPDDADDLDGGRGERNQRDIEELEDNLDDDNGDDD